MIAASGGEEITETDAAKSILDGRHFPPVACVPALSRPRPAGWGITFPMLHRQSQMFTAFLRASDPPATRRLVRDVLEVGELADPLARHDPQGLDGLWAAFVDALESAADGLPLPT